VGRDEQRAIVERATIRRGTVGSTLHGLHHGGQDDRDEMGVFIEPPAFALGLRLADSGSTRGYLRTQKERLIGVRGQKRVNRPELIAAHGFDTKYAMHVVRLGRQGVELLTTGRLTLPMAEPDRSRIMAIRRGEVLEADVVAEVEEVEAELEAAILTSPLPREPDYAAVDEFIVEAYREAWGW
jgi:RNA repair pathway DNA polymerase beta family